MKFGSEVTVETRKLKIHEISSYHEQICQSCNYMAGFLDSILMNVVFSLSLKLFLCGAIEPKCRRMRLKENPVLRQDLTELSQLDPPIALTYRTKALGPLEDQALNELFHYMSSSYFTNFSLFSNNSYTQFLIFLCSFQILNY